MYELSVYSVKSVHKNFCPIWVFSKKETHNYIYIWVYIYINMVCNICLSPMHTTVFDDLDLCVLCKGRVIDLKND